MGVPDEAWNKSTFDARNPTPWMFEMPPTMGTVQDHSDPSACKMGTLTMASEVFNPYFLYLLDLRHPEHVLRNGD